MDFRKPLLFVPVTLGGTKSFDTIWYLKIFSKIFSAGKLMHS